METLEMDSVPTECTLVPQKLSRAVHLTEPQREALFQLLAQFRTHREIKATMLESFGIQMGISTITYYVTTPKWAQQIRLARLSYLSKTMSVPIANKMVRMERLERVYQLHLRKQQLPEALATLKAAREEMQPLDQKSEVRDVYINQQIAYFDRAQCEKRLAEMEQGAETLEVTHGVREASTAVSSRE